MIADPEPNHVVAVARSQGPLLDTSSDGPIAPHFLEVERRMKRVRLQEFKILVCDSLNLSRKLFVGYPEALSRVVDPIFDSESFGLAGFELLDRRICQLIQFPGGNILIKLGVPLSRFESRKPLPEGGEILGSQLLHGSLD